MDRACNFALFRLAYEHLQQSNEGKADGGRLGFIAGCVSWKWFKFLYAKRL
jgi:hypothetical protein